MILYFLLTVNFQRICKTRKYRVFKLKVDR